MFNPDETSARWPSFAAEVGTPCDGAGLRERLYVPLAEARALVSDALQVEIVAARPAAAVRAPRGRRSRPATSPAPSATCSRLVGDGYRVFVVFRHEGEAKRATYRLRRPERGDRDRERWRVAARPHPGLYFVAAAAA